VLTGYSDVEPMFDAINRGSVYGFVVKPYQPEELRTMIQAALEEKDNAALLRYLVHQLSERRDELNRTAKQLQSKQEELLAAERLTAVGQATSGIVHNLRNLSTIMYALVREIRRKTTDRNLLDCAQQGFSAMESLIRLLEDINDFARVGGSSPALAPTDILALLKRVSRLATMDESRCPVKITAEPEAQVMSVDAERISQAVLALLDNALRASQPGTPVNMVVRRLGSANDVAAASVGPEEWACIEVLDRGEGMDEVTMDSATRPFFSGFSPSRLGLGLETARLAAQAHGGRLELTSSPHEGTCARIILPMEGTA
jgi:signal transduction histidine kinase